MLFSIVLVIRYKTEDEDKNEDEYMIKKRYSVRQYVRGGECWNSLGLN